MQTNTEFDRALASYEPRGLGARRTYPFKCPRCLRGLSTLRLLSRPPGRTDGPMVCGTCVLDDRRVAHTDQQRLEAREHAEKRKR